jgi:hypothetical protein
MSWPAALLALLVSHLVGDFLLQTEPQALDKVGGLGDPRGRRALLLHLAHYMAAFIPALVWIGVETTAVRAVLVAAVVAVPHLLIDDGRFVGLWLREVKRAPRADVGLRIAVDQSFHVVCLLGAALIAAA